MLQTCLLFYELSIFWNYNYMLAGPTLIVFLLTCISINAGPFRFLELPPSLKSDCYSYAHKWKVGTHFQNDPWKLYQIQNIEHFNKWLGLWRNFDTFLQTYFIAKICKKLKSCNGILSYHQECTAYPAIHAAFFLPVLVCPQKVVLSILIQNTKWANQIKNICNGHLDCIHGFFA